MVILSFCNNAHTKELDIRAAKTSHIHVQNVEYITSSMLQDFGTFGWVLNSRQTAQGCLKRNLNKLNFVYNIYCILV